VRESLPVPADLAPGRYALSVAVVDESLKPAVRLAVKGCGGDGWYPLGSVEIVR
jgi:hypothetical protein